MTNLIDKFSIQCSQIVAEVELMKQKTSHFQNQTLKLQQENVIIIKKNNLLHEGINKLQKILQELNQDQPQIDLINLVSIQTQNTQQIRNHFSLNLPDLSKAQAYLQTISKQNIEEIWKKQIVYEKNKSILLETKQKYQKKLEKLDQKYLVEVSKYKGKKRGKFDK